MKFKISKKSDNLKNLMRELGYHLDRKNESDEIAFYRRLRSGRFPRFHIYIGDRESKWVFKLHLDQKQVSYDGQTAHGGEYEGPLVEKEANRIKRGIKFVREGRKEAPKGGEDEDRKGNGVSWILISVIMIVTVVLLLLFI